MRPFEFFRTSAGPAAEMPCLFGQCREQQACLGSPLQLFLDFSFGKRRTPRPKFSRSFLGSPAIIGWPVFRSRLFGRCDKDIPKRHAIATRHRVSKIQIKHGPQRGGHLNPPTICPHRRLNRRGHQFPGSELFLECAHHSVPMAFMRRGQAIFSSSRAPNDDEAVHAFLETLPFLPLGGRRVTLERVPKREAKSIGRGHGYWVSWTVARFRTTFISRRNCG